jgi:hypothetical protein
MDSVAVFPIQTGTSNGWSSKWEWYVYGVSRLRSVGIGLESLCWLEDTEEIRTDEYDRFDASVDQVIWEPDAGIIRFG